MPFVVNAIHSTITDAMDTFIYLYRYMALSSPNFVRFNVSVHLFLCQVLGQYIENLMAASSVFQADGETRGRKG